MMFERFTEEARSAVVAAQEEARALHAGHIGAQHLVLGIAREPGRVAGPVLSGLGLDAPSLREALEEDDGDAAALASLGIDLDEVRRRVEAAFGEGALEGAPGPGGRRGRRDRGGMPFTPDAKKALELSLREALRLGDTHIGAEHVLLGTTRVREPALHAALRRRGRTADEVRGALLAAMREPGRATG
jgi:ATP-dependent Clp protease ATP-binding subunit ClpA